MGYSSSLLKSPKKEEEQQVPNSIWDDFKAFLELSDEEKPPPPPPHHDCLPLHWDFMDHHHFHDHFSLSETIANHGGHGDGDDEEASGGVVPKACSKVSLNLNLNYEEVLEAWSGRGSLWAAGSSLSNPTGHAGYVSSAHKLIEKLLKKAVTM